MNYNDDRYFGVNMKVSNSPKCVARFGLTNMEGQLNCFLNAALQSLWNLSPVSFSLKYYCQDALPTAVITDLNEARDIISEIKVNYLLFFISIQNFFKMIVDDRILSIKSAAGQRYDANKLRKVLFERFYTMNQFILNQKGDAAEAFVYLLDTIHSGCISTTSKKLQYEKECDSTCFIHE